MSEKEKVETITVGDPEISYTGPENEPTYDDTLSQLECEIVSLSILQIVTKKLQGKTSRKGCLQQ